jgi:hypothetical protein
MKPSIVPFDATAAGEEGVAPANCLYARIAGARWAALARSVRESHLENAAVRRFGHFQVRRGESLLARAIAVLLRMPAPGESVETLLVIERHGDGERWLRTFGRTILVTTQWQSAPGVLSEKVGAMELQFSLEVDGDSVEYHQIGAKLRLGPLSFPMPRVLQPRVQAREQADGDDHTLVHVAVYLPLLGLLASYGGRLGREEVL